MAASQQNATAGADTTVVRSGHLKKLKTNKKKFFVLRAESSESSARLEYYDSERKYNDGSAPKRCINLKSCFNINRRLDIKHKHVIALYTKDDCFCIVLETEQDLEIWLRDLLSLQQGEELVEGETLKPNFEHVWQVSLINRGLGTIGLMGNHRLCVTEESITLINIERGARTPSLVFMLSSIRSCGHLGCFLFIELGRSSPMGSGEVWMMTDDSIIARNILLYITRDKRFYNTTSKILKPDDTGPERRWRALPTTESSKRKLLNVLIKTQMLFQVKGVTSFYQLLFHKGTSKAAERRHSISGMADGPHRGRSGTLPPTTRSRTTSEGNPAMMFWRSHFHSFRPASVYRSHSPPAGSPVTPPSAGNSTDSTGSSYSLNDETDFCAEHDPLNMSRYGHSLTPEEAIAEEDYPEIPVSSAIYVPMTFSNNDDAYMEMSPKGNHQNNPPTTSVSSTLTLGNPSGDIRFVEYPLEKVSSYFPPSEDDETRPTRAYSVGSRPECQKKYLELITSNNENLRVRALSVGSKTKKVLGRVLPPYGHHTHHGSKSSSAPILSTVRGPGSHTSIGPMGDLMEMDFSRPNSSNNSGYMEMRAGLKNNHGYVPMKPGTIPNTNRNKTDSSPYVDMTSGSSPNRPSLVSPTVEHNGFSNDYMEMDPRKNSNNNNNTNNNNNATDYLTMSFNGSAERHSNINYQLSPVKTSLPYGSPFGSPKTEPPTPDGYVEMSLGRGHQRQSSLDSAQIVNEDYANMSMGKKRDRSCKKKDKIRSQPIAIQNSSNSTSKVNGGGASSSSPRYALLTRKFSTGTPPAMHLPLSSDSNSYSSLPRQKSRKNSSRDSKDSSSSSINTPSSSSTIFPLSLNSPCSPVKSEAQPAFSSAIKVPAGVLATVYKKTNKTDGDYTPMNFCKGDHSDYVNYNPAKTPVDEDDYAIMKPGVQLTSRIVVKQLVDGNSFRPINENREELKEKLNDMQTSEQPYEVLRPWSQPTSVTESTRNSLSRPNSASSELQSVGPSSGSTIIGSRPESVNSDRMRPPPVSSTGVQLHYASLDLEEGNRSPRNLKGLVTTGVTGEVSGQVEATLTYAAIDFVKSEGFKHNSLTSNTKIKH